MSNRRVGTLPPSAKPWRTVNSFRASRIVALKVLREIVFSPKHRSTIKERGELDMLIRDNTWIFGEGFHLTMHEAGLTQIMDRVSEQIATKRIKGTPVRKLDGKIGRIDSFMGRVVPNETPGHHEYLLVELKKPSIKVGRKETDQVEDYVNAILAQPDFINTSTQWNFYLVTSEYDDATRERITQENRPMGLLIDKQTCRDRAPRSRNWVVRRHVSSASMARPSVLRAPRPVHRASWRHLPAPSRCHDPLRSRLKSTSRHAEHGPRVGSCQGVDRRARKAASVHLTQPAVVSSREDGCRGIVLAPLGRNGL